MTLTFYLWLKSIIFSKPKTTMSTEYKVLSPIEHVLLRPSQYIGSVITKQEIDWVFDIPSQKMIQKEILYNEGLLKIISEVIDNAVDNSKRKDNPSTNIKVTMNDTTIIVTNDGHGIPIKCVDLGNGKEEYIPTTIFGVPMSGSNFNENREGTIGMNGLGVKLTNILSKEFKVICIDDGKKFKQVWTNNMKNRSKETITSAPVSAPFSTSITFSPDLDYFNSNDAEYTIDNLSVIEYIIYTRLLTISVSHPNPIKIYFNGKQIKCKGLKAYMKLFTDDRTFYDNVPGVDFEYGVTLSNTGKFEHQSFVNCQRTTSDKSTHTRYVTNKICSTVADYLKKKGSGKVKLSNNYIANYLHVFVNIQLLNSKFTSQTKIELSSTIPIKKYPIDTVKILGILKKSGLLGRLESALETKVLNNVQSTLNSSSKLSTINIPKLDDAHDAGTANSAGTMLFLVEGDSAKTMVSTGMTIIGRKKYGVFPLKGKVLNVIGAAPKKLGSNNEIVNIMKIMGLNFNKRYDTASERKTLRYSRLCILCDADSVTGDTPLLLRNCDGRIVVKNIEDIFDKSLNYVDINGKEYTSSRFQVWTERGWTGIKSVMRHHSTKTISRVVTHTGVVDVTEDHSLLYKDGTEVSPSNIQIGEKLLHSFPIFDDMYHVDGIVDDMNIKQLWIIASEMKIQYYQSIKKYDLINIIKSYQAQERIVLNTHCNVSVEEAWVMGFFMADGTCKIGTRCREDKEYTYYNWSITNTNLSLLEKSLAIVEKIYGYGIFKIYTLGVSKQHNRSQAYRLVLLGGKTTSYIIDMYRRFCYYDDYKYIHSDILNAPIDVRQTYYDGYYEGDGRHCVEQSPRFDVLGKITTQCLFVLAKSIGKTVSLNTCETKPDIYSVSSNNGTLQWDANKIKKIINIGKRNDYVYDLETENHHFQAGVGQLIVHNTDGHHITGLLITFINHFWPLLLQSGFLKRFVTPIIKISKGQSRHEFFTLSDYQDFVENNHMGGWKVKHLKGLGTSRTEETLEYFKNMESKHLKDFVITNDTSDLVSNIFDPTLSNWRKDWLSKPLMTRRMDYNDRVMEISRFLMTEMYDYSSYNIKRAVPSAIDGLKVSQRKIICTCLEKFKNESTVSIKVAQLASFVASHTNYAHGEISLQNTIVNMAQSFSGSNNIPYMYEDGAFGTRIANGSDSASPRYIFTKFTTMARNIITETSPNVLSYITEENVIVEPEFYVPSLPMVLVNGSNGIATGFRSVVPLFNPLDIEHNIMCKFNSSMVPIILVPWYGGTYKTNDKTTVSNDQWVFEGKVDRGSNNTIVITELPIGISIDDYKDNVLTKMIETGTITRVVVDHVSENEPKFIVYGYGNTDDGDLIDRFKLQHTMTRKCMNLLDIDGHVRNFKTASEILDYWFDIRQTYVKKTHTNTVNNMVQNMEQIQHKLNFIKGVVTNKIEIRNRSRVSIINTMVSDLKIPEDLCTKFLQVPLVSITKERYDALVLELQCINNELEKYNKLTVNDIIISELGWYNTKKRRHDVDLEIGYKKSKI